jgi:transforming growth factor-beta-induced protein
MTFSYIWRGLTAVGLSLALLLPGLPVQAQAQQNIVQIASETESTSTLVEAVVAANLTETLSGEGPFTVFAPTNEAFASLGNTLNVLLDADNQDLLADVLTYHVVAGDVPASQAITLDSADSVQGDVIQIATRGDDLFLNNSARVTTADIEASNGRIHLINQVILSPSLSDRIQQAVDASDQTVADIVTANDRLTTLEEVLRQADLLDTLSNAGPYTLFAPTDAAFEQLSQEQLDALLNESNRDLLEDVLTYHVVSGDIPSSQAVNLNSATSLQGDEISLSVENGSLFLNGQAEVITADIGAANGQVHLVNEVILSDDLSQRLDEVVQDEDSTNAGFDWSDPLFWGGLILVVIIVVIILAWLAKKGGSNKDQNVYRDNR